MRSVRRALVSLLLWPACVPPAPPAVPVDPIEFVVFDDIGGGTWSLRRCGLLLGYQSPSDVRQVCGFPVATLGFGGNHPSEFSMCYIYNGYSQAIRSNVQPAPFMGACFGPSTRTVQVDPTCEHDWTVGGCETKTVETPVLTNVFGLYGLPPGLPLNTGRIR